MSWRFVQENVRNDSEATVQPTTRRTVGQVLDRAVFCAMIGLFFTLLLLPIIRRIFCKDLSDCSTLEGLESVYLG